MGGGVEYACKARKMGQLLKALAVLSEVPNSSPSSHMATICNSQSHDLVMNQVCAWHTELHAGKHLYTFLKFLFIYLFLKYSCKPSTGEVCW